jgi:hypothetical protein
MKKEKIVSYTREEIPSITPDRLREMIALSQLPDSEIDYSDIPQITPEQAKQAVRGWENHPGRARNRKPHAA